MQVLPCGPVSAQEEVTVEAVEAVEAVAVDEDLLEEGTGVVGKGNGRSTSQDDNSKHSMELAGLNACA